MPVLFAESETRMNLMRAFAGESQARNRYTFAANLAKSQNLQVIEQVFTFTAAQEQQHAKCYYNQLSTLTGQTVKVDGTYPVDIFPDLLQHLRAAQKNEYGEWQHDYAGFSKTAQREGFEELATLFSGIGAIEKTHGDRFGRFADLLEGGKLFVADAQCRWMCLNCGDIERAVAAPALCPVCKHPQGFFVRWELAPFQN